NGLYTVTVTDSMCSNTLTSTVLVNVNALPAQPTAQAVTGCGLSAATISASGTAQSFIWSDNSSGLPVLGTDSAYTAHNLQPGTTYTFYVQAVNAGCPPSAAVAVPVTALSVPSVASWPPLASICSGETVQLSAAGANSYQWIPAASI